LLNIGLLLHSNSRLILLGAQPRVLCHEGIELRLKALSGLDKFVNLGFQLRVVSLFLLS